MQWIKKDHPDWHRWLLEKKLLAPKMVRREACGIVRWENGAGYKYPVQIDGPGLSFSYWFQNKIQGKLTFEWDEPEGESK